MGFLVTTDPQLLRSEAFAEIGSAIQRDAGVIVERWCRRAVLEQPDAKRCHHAVLRDGLGPLLKDLGRGLADSIYEDTPQHHVRAVEHGEQRWQAGWSLTEVVRDYQILRLVLLEYLEDSLDRPLALREIMAIGLALDEAITASVIMYVAFGEEAKRQTEHERAEADRRSSAELDRWQKIFEHAGWGVTLVEASSHHLTTVNRAFAQMHGYGAGELRGRCYLDLVAPELRHEVAHQFGPGPNGDHHTFECVHIRRDGSRFPVLAALTAFRDARGKVLHYAANFQDISDRKALEQRLAAKAQRLEEADRQKDRFLAMLAHELRNPLSAIQNATEWMQLSTTDPDALETGLAVADRQVRQVARLVDDLLDVARISQGKFDLRRQSVDLAEVVGAAVESSQALIDGKSQRLEVVLPAEPIPLDADPARLHQVLGNLLNNAAKYTDEGGEISLTARRTDGHVQIHVRDTGVGIAPELLPHVFELFRQSDATAGRVHGGLGIGLTLVRSLIEMHGGSVSAASPGKGQGSQFTVQLPIADEIVAEVSPMSDAKPRPAGSAHARILLVDDNKDVVSMLAILLRRVGHEVVMAHDGFAALDTAQREAPEVVLLDIGLPGMDGYAVAE